MRERTRRIPALILAVLSEHLPGKRVHASRGLPGPDCPEDGDSGVEAPLRDHEPVRVGNLSRLDRVMRLPDDDGCALVRVPTRFVQEYTLRVRPETSGAH